MNLTSKQIKNIKKLHKTESTEVIARKMRLPVKVVRQLLADELQAPQHRAQKLFSAKRLTEWSLCLFVFLTPLVFIKGIFDFANLPQLFFIQLFACFFTLAWLVQAFQSKQLSIHCSRLCLPIAAFLVWAAFSLLTAHNSYEGANVWMHWFMVSVFFLAVANLDFRDETIIRVLYAFALSGAAVALVGLAQHFLDFSAIPQASKPAATLANKNMAAQYMVLTFPAAFALIFYKKSYGEKLLCTLVTLIIFSFLIIAKSRGAYVAFIMETVVFSFLFIRTQLAGKNMFSSTARARRYGIFIGAALFMLLAFGNFFRAPIQEILNLNSERVFQSFEIRRDIWLNTLEMIKNNPLTGVGLGNHKIYYPLYHHKVAQEKAFSETAQLEYVHNDPLQITAELGFPGLLLILWILFNTLKIGLAATSPNMPSRDRLLAAAMLTSILGISVNSCFSFPLHRSVPPLAIMLQLGLLSRMSPADKHPYTIRSQVLTGAFSILSFLLLASILFWYPKAIAADRHYLNLKTHENAANWQAMVNEGEKALQYNPYRLKIYSFMGRAYVEMGQFEKGVELLQKILTGYPYHMNALLNLGVALEGLGQDDKALEAYEKILEFKNDYFKVYNNIGHIQLKNNKKDEAYKNFKKSIELEPNIDKAQFNFGIAATETEHYEEAAAAFAKVIELNPAWDLAYKNLGVIYLRHLSRVAEGIQLLKKSLELNPKIPDHEQMRMFISDWEKKQS